MTTASAMPGGTAAVIGAGTMGRGIAQTLAAAGYEVLLFDQNEAAARDAAAFAGTMLNRAAEKGRLSPQAAVAAAARITVATSLGDLAPAAILIEAIAESLEAKQILFARLETIVGPQAVLATNTSSLSVSAIAAGVGEPGRVVGLHFFNPVPLMKVVEVIPGLRTDDRAIRAALGIAEAIGYRAILCRDAPGFLINHAGRGLTTEGIRIVQENIAAEADVDRVMREAAGFRMGPFELLDLTGLDVSLPVLRLIYDQFYQEPRYRPGVHLAARVEAGLNGRKTGEGFYRYADGQRQEPPEPEQPETPLPRLWVPPEMRDDLSALLSACAECGVSLEDGPAPPAEGVLLIAPWGWDATTTAQRLDLDARRVMAVDPLTADRERVTIMSTPVTDAAVRVALHHALRVAGRRVTAIADSPGFIAQRVLATIVNIGCEIAQMEIAAPRDIDDGVRLGLGYPEGPLALGDRIGPARVLAILEAMQQLYGDPRYRPSIWLRRRAALGMALGPDAG